MYETRDQKLLHDTLYRCNQLIYKPYLYELSSLYHSSPSVSSDETCLSLFKLTTLPTSTSPSGFTYLLNALKGLNQTIAYLLYTNPKEISVYIGLKGIAHHQVALELLKSGFTQSFPEITLTPIENPSDLLAKLLHPKLYTLLATSSSIPPPQPFLKDFQSLVGNTHSYLTLFLSNPCQRTCLITLLDELCSLYQTLSLFVHTNYNLLDGLSKNTSETNTSTHTQLDGSTNSLTTGSSNSCNQGSYINLSGALPVPYSEGRAINVSILQNKALATVNVQNQSMTKGTSSNLSHAHSNAKLSATNKVDNYSISFSETNPCIQNKLDELALHISRLQSLLNNGCFEFVPYFLSPIKETALRAAYNFSGICQNLSTASSLNVVNFWPSTDPNFNAILTQLEHFDFPSFCYNTFCFQEHQLVLSNEFVSCFYQ